MSSCKKSTLSRTAINMKNSILNVQRELGLTSEEITALKRSSRLWLEQEYGRSHGDIAQIRTDDIKSSASRFLDQNGSLLFSSPISKGRITGIYDSLLVSKMVSVMACQVEYSREKVKETVKNSRKTKALVNMDEVNKTRKDKRRRKRKKLQAHSDSNVRSASSEDSESTNEASTDDDYAPTDNLLVTPLSKTHNTRQNTQPGMPICQSIESISPRTANDVILRQATSPMIRNAPGPDLVITGPEAETVNDPRRILEVVNVVRSSGRRTEISEVSVTQSTSAPTVLHQQRGAVDNNQPFMIPLETTRSEALQGRIQGPPPSSSSDSIQSTQKIQQAPSFPNINFDQFLESNEELDDDFELSSDVIAWLKTPPRANRHKVLRCEQTPPSSARSVVDSEPSQLYGSQDVDVKPRLHGITKTVVDLTIPEEEKLFLEDDSVVVKKVQAVPILQHVLDFLSDKSRERQRTAQRLSASLSQRNEAQQQVVFLRGVIGDLYENLRMWAGDPSLTLDSS